MAGVLLVGLIGCGGCGPASETAGDQADRDASAAADYEAVRRLETDAVQAGEGGPDTADLLSRYREVVERDPGSPYAVAALYRLAVLGDPADTGPDGARDDGGLLVRLVEAAVDNRYGRVFEHLSGGRAIADTLVLNDAGGRRLILVRSGRYRRARLRRSGSRDIAFPESLPSIHPFLGPAREGWGRPLVLAAFDDTAEAVFSALPADIRAWYGDRRVEVEAAEDSLGPRGELQLLHDRFARMSVSGEELRRALPESGAGRYLALGNDTAEASGLARIEVEHGNLLDPGPSVIRAWLRSVPPEPIFAMRVDGGAGPAAFGEGDGQHVEIRSDQRASFHVVAWRDEGQLFLFADSYGAGFDLLWDTDQRVPIELDLASGYDFGPRYATVHAFALNAERYVIRLDHRSAWQRADLVLVRRDGFGVRTLADLSAPEAY